MDAKRKAQNAAEQAAEKEELKERYSLENLNRAIASTYRRDNYADAIQDLRPYHLNKELDRHIRARALFYTGLAMYRLQRYRRSIEYFINALVQESYPERAEFWYNRALEKIRN